MTCYPVDSDTEWMQVGVGLDYDPIDKTVYWSDIRFAVSVSFTCGKLCECHVTELLTYDNSWKCFILKGVRMKILYSADIMRNIISLD